MSHDGTNTSQLDSNVTAPNGHGQHPHHPGHHHQPHHEHQNQPHHEQHHEHQNQPHHEHHEHQNQHHHEHHEHQNHPQHEQHHEHQKQPHHEHPHESQQEGNRRTRRRSTKRGEDKHQPLDVDSTALDENRLQNRLAHQRRQQQAELLRNQAQNRQHVDSGEAPLLHSQDQPLRSQASEDKLLADLFKGKQPGKGKPEAHIHPATRSIPLVKGIPSSSIRYVTTPPAHNPHNPNLHRHSQYSTASQPQEHSGALDYIAKHKVFDPAPVTHGPDHFGTRHSTVKSQDSQISQGQFPVHTGALDYVAKHKENPAPPKKHSAAPETPPAPPPAALSVAPLAVPFTAPSVAPSVAPTAAPSVAPPAAPSVAPPAAPSVAPPAAPSVAPPPALPAVPSAAPPVRIVTHRSSQGPQTVISIVLSQTKTASPPKVISSGRKSVKAVASQKTYIPPVRTTTGTQKDAEPSPHKSLVVIPLKKSSGTSDSPPTRALSGVKATSALLGPVAPPAKAPSITQIKAPPSLPIFPTTTTSSPRKEAKEAFDTISTGVLSQTRKTSPVTSRSEHSRTTEAVSPRTNSPSNRETSKTPSFNVTPTPLEPYTSPRLVASPKSNKSVVLVDSQDQNKLNSLRSLHQIPSNPSSNHSNQSGKGILKESGHTFSGLPGPSPTRSSPRSAPVDFQGNHLPSQESAQILKSPPSDLPVKVVANRRGSKKSSRRSSKRTGAMNNPDNKGPGGNNNPPMELPQPDKEGNSGMLARNAGDDAALPAPSTETNASMDAEGNQKRPSQGNNNNNNVPRPSKEKRLSGQVTGGNADTQGGGAAQGGAQGGAQQQQPSQQQGMVMFCLPCMGPQGVMGFKCTQTQPDAEDRMNNTGQSMGLNDIKFRDFKAMQEVLQFPGAGPSRPDWFQQNQGGCCYQVVNPFSLFQQQQPQQCQIQPPQPYQTQQPQQCQAQQPQQCQAQQPQQCQAQQPQQCQMSYQGQQSQQCSCQQYNPRMYNNTPDWMQSPLIRNFSPAPQQPLMDNSVVQQSYGNGGNFGWNSTMPPTDGAASYVLPDSFGTLPTVFQPLSEFQNSMFQGMDNDDGYSMGFSPGPSQRQTCPCGPQCNCPANCPCRTKSCCAPPPPCRCAKKSTRCTCPVCCTQLCCPAFDPCEDDNEDGADNWNSGQEENIPCCKCMCKPTCPPPPCPKKCPSPCPPPCPTPCCKMPCPKPCPSPCPPPCPTPCCRECPCPCTCPCACPCQCPCSNQVKLVREVYHFNKGSKRSTKRCRGLQAHPSWMQSLRQKCGKCSKENTSICCCPNECCCCEIQKDRDCVVKCVAVECPKKERAPVCLVREFVVDGAGAPPCPLKKEEALCCCQLMQQKPPGGGGCTPKCCPTPKFNCSRKKNSNRSCKRKKMPQYQVIECEDDEEILIYPTTDTTTNNSSSASCAKSDSDFENM